MGDVLSVPFIVSCLEPNPLSGSFYDTTLGLIGVDGYVPLI